MVRLTAPCSAHPTTVVSIALDPDAVGGKLPLPRPGSAPMSPSRGKSSREHYWDEGPNVRSVEARGMPIHVLSGSTDSAYSDCVLAIHGEGVGRVPVAVV